MFNKKSIEAGILKMDLSSVKVPSEEFIDDILSHGKTRILQASGSKLDADSLEYFNFCWTQVGFFEIDSINAIEIGYRTFIQPIYIACAIHRYGMDWAFKFFHLKRITAVHRGEFSILRTNNNFFSIFGLKRNIDSPMRVNNSTLKALTRSNDVDGLRLYANDPMCGISLLFKEPPIFSVDSGIPAEKAKRKRTPKGDYNPKYNGVDAEI